MFVKLWLSNEDYIGTHNARAHKVVPLDYPLSHNAWKMFKIHGQI